MKKEDPEIIEELKKLFGDLNPHKKEDKEEIKKKADEWLKEKYTGIFNKE